MANQPIEDQSKFEKRFTMEGEKLDLEIKQLKQSWKAPATILGLLVVLGGGLGFAYKELQQFTEIYRKLEETRDLEREASNLRQQIQANRMELLISQNQKLLAGTELEATKRELKDLEVEQDFLVRKLEVESVIREHGNLTVSRDERNQNVKRLVLTEFDVNGPLRRALEFCLAHEMATEVRVYLQDTDGILESFVDAIGGATLNTVEIEGQLDSDAIEYLSRLTNVSELRLNVQAYEGIQNPTAFIEFSPELPLYDEEVRNPAKPYQASTYTLKDIDQLRRRLSRCRVMFGRPSLMAALVRQGYKPNSTPPTTEMLSRAIKETAVVLEETYADGKQECTIDLTCADLTGVNPALLFRLPNLIGIRAHASQLQNVSPIDGEVPEIETLVIVNFSKFYDAQENVTKFLEMAEKLVVFRKLVFFYSDTVTHLKQLKNLKTLEELEIQLPLLTSDMVDTLNEMGGLQRIILQMPIKYEPQKEAIKKLFSQPNIVIEYRENFAH